MVFSPHLCTQIYFFTSYSKVCQARGVLQRRGLSQLVTDLFIGDPVDLFIGDVVVSWNSRGSGENKQQFLEAAVGSVPHPHAGIRPPLVPQDVPSV